MLTISENAQQHFQRLIQQQDIPGLGIRMQVVNPGTPDADCRLEFCELGDLAGDEWAMECDGFTLYVEAASMAYLDDAQVDYETNATGGQLSVRAPKIKGQAPAADASLEERVRHILTVEINPQVAAHGGRVSLVEIAPDNVVVLRFGGGCHGCGMADVTLKQGIEKTLRTRLPEITEVRDATDHASGHEPYYRGQHGSSALR